MNIFEALRIYAKEREMVPDPDQDVVVELKKGYNMVLAPPGCGKTLILAKRVVGALQSGVNVKDMLCLTFTNRAARGMRNRIDLSLEDKAISAKLFVGNVHRFCSNFLYENKIIAQTSAILDETDTTNILLSLLDKNETEDELDYKDREQINKYYILQHFIYQLRHHHPEELILGSSHDISDNIICFCEAFNVPYSTESFLQLYEKLKELEVPYDVEDFYNELYIAKAYEDYKQDKGLYDFDDLLLNAYDYMSNNPDKYRHYNWIQIDEVQDLNRLQLAIVDLLFTNPKEGILLYLGDEQQAIFSFIGAKLSTLSYLKERCKGNLFHLHSNHRSPKYLLDVYNTYAEKVLDVDSDLLPKPTSFLDQQLQDLKIEHALWNYEEYDLIVDLALSYSQEGRTAILVPFNKDADAISKKLDDKGIPHFKISGKDLFSEKTVQTLFAHFNVIGFETNLMAWSKIFRNLKIYPSYSIAREFVSQLQSLMLCPTDFIYYDNSSYVEKFCNAYKGELVIFDTETTGLDIFEDDIVQIAAIRVRDGKIGDTFNIILHTDKEIPPYLGDIPNPMVEEYNTRTDHLDRRTGLLRFLEFVGDTPLIGHNVEYDYHILDYNLRRDCNIDDLAERCPIYYDTLKLCHIVEPRLKSYKLKDLLIKLDLEGNNTHLADEDVMATKSLADYCKEKALGIIQKQKDFILSNKDHISKFVSVYAPLYLHTKERLYSKETPNGHCALVDELLYLYETLTDKEIISPLRKFSYIVDYLDVDVIKKNITPTLKQQLDKHIIEMNTYKEADLCDDNSKSMREKIFISTVHKAKGLEFPNVIVSSVVDDVYPKWINKDSNNRELLKEDARLLYVAMTRAKRRLCLVSYRTKKVWSDKWGRDFDFNVADSRFLVEIRHFFNKCSKQIEPNQINTGNIITGKIIYLKHGHVGVQCCNGEVYYLQDVSINNCKYAKGTNVAAECYDFSHKYVRIVD